MRERAKNKSVADAAMKAGMSEKTASKYIRDGKLPSEIAPQRKWRTRVDPFDKVWGKIEEMLRDSPGLEAKTIFENYLCVEYPGQFSSGQLRTLQRRVQRWRAEYGPPRDIVFRQQHLPGEAFQTDFTSGNKLGITIYGVAFTHMFCQVTLPFSNWQWATVCQSESIMAIKMGLQAAIFELGYTPRFSQTDNSTCATHRLGNGNRGFNERYIEFLSHFNIQARTIYPGCSQQNGDVEALNRSLKRRLDQHLLLRGRRDFDSVEEYQRWVQNILRKSNSMRADKIQTELKSMTPVHASPLPEWVHEDCQVSQTSTINVRGNVYSVPSRLIGQKLTIHIYDDKLRIFLEKSHQMDVERLRGRNRAKIDYRHVIWSLVRKPGAFRRYRYREEMFPSLIWRRVYDALLCLISEREADLEYLRILHQAAAQSQTEVETAIALLFEGNKAPRYEAIRGLVDTATPSVPALQPLDIDLTLYDQLIPEDK